MPKKGSRVGRRGSSTKHSAVDDAGGQHSSKRCKGRTEGVTRRSGGSQAEDSAADGGVPDSDDQEGDVKAGRENTADCDSKIQAADQNTQDPARVGTATPSSLQSDGEDDRAAVEVDGNTGDEDVRPRAPPSGAVCRAPLTSIMAEIWNEGFTTVATILSADEVDLVHRAGRATHLRQWLRHLGNQNKRQMTHNLAEQAAADHPAFRLVLERFIELASQIHPAWSVMERLTVIDTEAGADTEQPHRDFMSSETAQTIIETEWVQTTFLLVLDPDMVVAGVPGVVSGSYQNENWVGVANLEPGDMLVYRGGLTHAQAATKLRQICIQGCVNVEGIEHDPNVVERVAWGFFRCVHCLERCGIKRALSNHGRYCNKNPGKEEIAKKRKTNNDKAAFCPRCDHHIAKKNIYDDHKCIAARERAA